MTATLVHSATIPDGASVSNSINLAGALLSHIHVPASFEGGFLQFEVSPTENGTYLAMRDKDGNIIRYTASSSTCIRVNSIDFLGVEFLKVRSTDGSGASAAQSGDAAVVLVSVP